MRSSPSAPSSSTPAVSTNSTGPSGSNSIGFSTGSVVVPATADTMDTCCRVIAFSSEDLPTFLRPKRPMWSRNAFGAACISAPPSRIRAAGALNPSRDTASADVQASNCSAVTNPSPTAVSFRLRPRARSTSADARA